jgi:hypothetical protein
VYTDVKLPKPFITSVASIDEIDNPSFEFSVFPVPLQEQVSVEFVSPTALSTNLCIFNEQGALAVEKSFDSNEGKNVVSLPTGFLPSGTYLVVLRLGTHFSCKTIMK